MPIGLCERGVPKARAIARLHPLARSCCEVQMTTKTKTISDEVVFVLDYFKLMLFKLSELVAIIANTMPAKTRTNSPIRPSQIPNKILLPL